MFQMAIPEENAKRWSVLAQFIKSIQPHLFERAETAKEIIDKIDELKAARPYTYERLQPYIDVVDL